MSDLHRAVSAEIDAFLPDRTPPFSGLLDRHQAQVRRRKAVAAAGCVLTAALLMPVVWSSATGGGDSRLEQADSAPPPATRPVFGIHPVWEVARIDAPASGSGCGAAALALAGEPGDSELTACSVSPPEVYRLGPAAVTGNDVAKATAVNTGGDWNVQLDFTADGGRAFAALTGEAACAPLSPYSPQRRLAFVLDGTVLDGEGSVAPDVQCGVGITSQSAVLRTGLDEAAAKELAERIAAAKSSQDTSPETTRYSITYDSEAAYNRHIDAVDTCLALPGTSDMSAEYSLPPTVGVTLAGSRENAAFQECLSGLEGVSVTPAPSESSPSQPAEDPATRTVEIFLSTEANCGDVQPVERQVPATEAVGTAALQELFSGRLTPADQAAGLTGFGPDTADLLRSLKIADGTAYVDLNASLQNNIGYASTSCGGSAFQAMIATTLRQFPTVKDVRYAFDGDPRAFYEFSQEGCPPPPTPADENRCDPRPWRSPEGG